MDYSVASASRSATAFSPSIPKSRPGRARGSTNCDKGGGAAARRLPCCASSVGRRPNGRSHGRRSTPKDDAQGQPARRGPARGGAGAVPDGCRRHGLHEILAEFESHWIGREVEGEQYLPAEAAFFRDIVGGVVREQRQLDPLIDAALHNGWPLKRIEAVMRAVLRAGAYELDHRKDVPARVIVSEYVDVAHAFVEGDETGMVNAVLDQLAREMRAGRVRRAAAERWRRERSCARPPKTS